MHDNYRSFFGLTREPFTADISRKDILETPAIKSVQDRVLHAINIGATALITGEIGSGKSTALRFVTGGLHPSRYKIIHITAIHQGSGGLFRKANHLARGAMIAAAKNQATMVAAEHVRLAATEIF